MHHQLTDNQAFKRPEHTTTQSPKLTSGDQVKLIRDIKGPAASILWMLVFSGRRLSQEDLANNCGYSVTVVDRALKHLRRYGVVTGERSSGWSLDPGFRQAILQTITLQGMEDESPARQATRPDVNEQTDKLAHILSHMGITSPAYDWLLARENLRSDPSPLVAWWWHYLTETWPDNRAGLVIRRILDGNQPPEAFLILARTWPLVAEEDRQEMEDLVWRNWPSSLMAHTFGQVYPALTASVFDAYRALLSAAPEELNI